MREIRQATDRPPLVQSIIGMAHALGKRVVAEGIETEAQLRALIDMDCDVGQGFLLGRPAPPDKVALTPAAGLCHAGLIRLHVPAPRRQTLL